MVSCEFDVESVRERRRSLMLLMFCSDLVVKRSEISSEGDKLVSLFGRKLAGVFSKTTLCFFFFFRLDLDLDGVSSFTPSKLSGYGLEYDEI